MKQQHKDFYDSLDFLYKMCKDVREIHFYSFKYFVYTNMRMPWNKLCHQN